jgi:hypothetical protein
MIKEVDLIGFQFSPEIFEEAQKLENKEKEFYQANKYVKEFCLEKKVSYNKIPFETKLLILKCNLNKIKIDWREGYSTIVINRETLLKDSMDQWDSINIFKELKINFIGETSYDAGGLIREWFTAIFKQILLLKLFTRTECDEFSFKINSDYLSLEHLQFFRFIGGLLAKAVLENVSINTCFNLLIYKMLLDEKIKLKHLEYYDKQVIFYCY